MWPHTKTTNKVKVNAFPPMFFFFSSTFESASALLLTLRTYNRKKTSIQIIIHVLKKIVLVFHTKKSPQMTFWQGYILPEKQRDPLNAPGGVATVNGTKI